MLGTLDRYCLAALIALSLASAVSVTSATRTGTTLRMVAFGLETAQPSSVVPEVTKR